MASFFWFVPILLGILFFGCRENHAVRLRNEIRPFEDFQITISPENPARMNQSFLDNTEYPVTITHNGKELPATMRYRGDSSRHDRKKSIKIKFKEGSFFENNNTLNFNAEFSDKTMIRQWMSSKLMTMAGQICYRADLVKIHLNGQYLGLYLNVENMDKYFLERHGLSAENNLYKATKDGACMSRFDDLEKHWEKKTNKKGDFEDLKTLIHELHTTPDNEFEAWLKNTFEYDRLINLIALNMMLSNGSTYYHNYYLYHDLHLSGKWQMFPWDMDKTLSAYNWKPYTYHETSSDWESDNPLIERALLCPPVFSDIQKRVDELHNTLLNDRTVTPAIDKLAELIAPHIAADTLDNIVDEQEWRTNIAHEKVYFDAHYTRLKAQFNNQPKSFVLVPFHGIQTDILTFRWSTSGHRSGKKLSYTLTFGPDFLLSDSLTTRHFENLTDTAFVLTEKLPPGRYYWKVKATDGTFSTTGFNSKAVFDVVSPTLLQKDFVKNTTLTTEGSPYVVIKDLSVMPGVTLTIEPGVTLLFKQNVALACHGNIHAKGTEAAPILLAPENTATAWDCIYFYEKAITGTFEFVHFLEGVLNSKQTDINLTNCSLTLRNKKLEHGKGAMFWADGGQIVIDNCDFQGNNTGEGLVFFNARPQVARSRFEGMPDAIEYISCESGKISENYINGSTDDAIDLNNCRGIHITDNYIFNARDKGISVGTEEFGPSANNNIFNNVLVGNAIGIAVKDSSEAMILGNTFVNNPVGIYLHKKREDFKQGGNAHIGMNVFYGSAKADLVIDAFSTAKTEDCISNLHDLVPGIVKTDFDFINSKRNNFRLANPDPLLTKEPIGAYERDSFPFVLAVAKAKTSDGQDALTGIEIRNPHNLPLDISGYQIVLKNETKEKRITLPLGTWIGPFSSLMVVPDYRKYIPQNAMTVLGNLPKMKSATEVNLIDNLGKPATAAVRLKPKVKAVQSKPQP